MTLGYDGDDSESYSNKYDLESFARKYDGDPNYRAYRAIISQKGSSPTGVIQTISKNEWGPIPFFGRRVLKTVDWNLIKTWYRTCWESHRGSCDRLVGTSKELSPHFRVIDLAKNQIVRAPIYHKKFRFVALSYVWGEDRIDLAKYNHKLLRSDLDKEGSAALPSELPPTIKDAVTITERLGFRYLWVDALCIIQDDDQDKDNQLPFMNAVYDRATLTIAAACGKHCAEGIAGVSRSRLFPQAREVISNELFAAVMPSFPHMNRTDGLCWNTRGWSLQEKLFSRRLLLFTEFQVYFRCANAIWQEDTRLEYPRLSTNFHRRSSPFRWAPGRHHRAHVTGQSASQILEHEPPTNSSSGTRDRPRLLRHKSLSSEDLRATFGKATKALPKFVAGVLPSSLEPETAKHSQLFDNYTAVIEEYTRRDLGRPADNLFAIQGILWSLDRGRMKNYGGLPVGVLPQLLLWQPREGSEMYRLKTAVARLVERKDGPTEVRHEGIEAPTWSWARWRLGEGCFWEEGIKIVEITSTLVPFDAVKQDRKGNFVERKAKAAGFYIQVRNAHLARISIGHRLSDPRPGRGGDLETEDSFDIVIRHSLIDEHSNCVGEALVTTAERGQAVDTLLLEIGRGESQMVGSLQDIIRLGPSVTKRTSWGDRRDSIKSKSATSRRASLVSPDGIVRTSVRVVYGLLISLDDHNIGTRVAVGKVFEGSWDALMTCYEKSFRLI